MIYADINTHTDDDELDSELSFNFPSSSPLSPHHPVNPVAETILHDSVLASWVAHDYIVGGSQRSLPPVPNNSMLELTYDEIPNEAVSRPSTRSTLRSSFNDSLHLTQIPSTSALMTHNHNRDVSGGTALTVPISEVGDDGVVDWEKNEDPSTMEWVTGLIETDLGQDVHRNGGDSPSRFSHQSAMVGPLFGGHGNKVGGEESDFEEVEPSCFLDKTERHRQNEYYYPGSEQLDDSSGTMTATTTKKIRDVEKYCPNFTTEFAQQIKDCSKLLDDLADPDETARVMSFLKNKPGLHAINTNPRDALLASYSEDSENSHLRRADQLDFWHNESYGDLSVWEGTMFDRAYRGSVFCLGLFPNGAADRDDPDRAARRRGYEDDVLDELLGECRDAARKWRHRETRMPAILEDAV